MEGGLKQMNDVTLGMINCQEDNCAIEQAL